MRITYRRLPKGETDRELLFGTVLLVFALAATALAALDLPFQPACWLRSTTGIPCPACGSWRCLHELLQGRFGAAFRSNPLAAVLAALGVLYLAYAWSAVIFRLARLRVEGLSRAAKWLLAGLAAAAVAANWVYLLVAL